MTKPTFKGNPLLKVLTSTLIKLPAPSNISTFWNFGSLLSLCLLTQILSGLLLASAYTPSMDLSFHLTFQSMESMDQQWLLRYVHANGASLFFACLYTHMGRSIYYSSFLYTPVWLIGVTILLLAMAAAFTGYVLPVNQMSYWGASVITNLFSQVPYIGPNIVQFIWGGPSVNTPTITRFFMFHFIVPFIILTLVLAHITMLHQTGSNNPLGLSSSASKIQFNVFFTIKDAFGVLITASIFLSVVFYYPLFLGDDESFNIADPAVTPQHIKPEWYFLFAYAILRSIPNKLGGIIALALSVLIFYLLPLTFLSKMKSTSFYPLNSFLFWTFIAVTLLLTWIGMRPVEEPYILTGQILTILYFGYFIVSPLSFKLWDSL
nr:TPA_asm: CYTB [Baikalogammarus pullus]